MGQILHGSARTTEGVRRAIQNSEESLRVLSKKYGVNQKTVSKWRKRDFVHDAPMGPKQPRSTVLSEEEEAACVAFRQYTLLPLDDCLYTLQSTIPHLSRSALHRLFQRHGISRLPNIQGDKPVKKKFKKYPIGYFHIDIAGVRTKQGKLYLFVAIDRTSKFAYVELHEHQTKQIAADFCRHLMTAVPYKITHILTENGIQFTNRTSDAYAFIHIFDRVCHEHGVEHRLTRVKHPWTNGQVERMNRTIKEATVKRYYYTSHEQLKVHLHTFMMAYNFARRLKTLKGLTPYEYICKISTKQPERFNLNPFLHNMGLNS